MTLPSAQATGDVVARQLAAAPLLDGYLDEWVDGPTHESQFRVFTAQQWDGTDDVTATWRLAWNSNNLYVAAQVADDIKDIAEAELLLLGA